MEIILKAVIIKIMFKLNRIKSLTVEIKRGLVLMQWLFCGNTWHHVGTTIINLKKMKENLKDYWINIY